MLVGISDDETVAIQRWQREDGAVIYLPEG